MESRCKPPVSDRRSLTSDTPYNVAIVQLEEGPRMLSNIVDVDPSELGVDLAVTVVFDQVSEDISLPRFRLMR